MSRTYKQNRKLPFTKRNEYNEKDELDSGDIEISFPDKAKATKTNNGFDNEFGARSLYRLIQKEVKDVSGKQITLDGLK